MIAVADRIISVTFKPPNHKDRGTKRRHTKAWGDYFNKHVCHSKDSHVNGFIWSYSIIEGEGGQLCYLRKSPEDLADDWARMVQLLKNNGFVIERKEDGWHCRPALKCPNKFTIMIWRIRHAVDGFFRKPMETVEFRKRASPKQNNSSPSAAKTTGKEPSSYRDGSSADGGVPSVRGNLQIHSPYAANNDRLRRETPSKQPPRIHNVITEGTDRAQAPRFTGDSSGNGVVIRGAFLPNSSVTVSNFNTLVRDVTQLDESDEEIGRVFDGAPSAAHRHGGWGGGRNNIVIENSNINGIYYR
jgi:hypothetical protein